MAKNFGERIEEAIQAINAIDDWEESRSPTTSKTLSSRR
jgi:hypothetical protein